MWRSGDCGGHEGSITVPKVGRCFFFFHLPEVEQLHSDEILLQHAHIKTMAHI